MKSIVQILFVDESGTTPPLRKITPKYFIVGGVVIAEDQWHHNMAMIDGSICWSTLGGVHQKVV
jgi:hypothetical protein